MHIFITGGTRGIGLGLVKEFLKRGHSVSYTGTTQNSLDQHIGELDGSFFPIVCDVRERKQIETAKDLAMGRFGNIHIWINNAGVSQKNVDVSELSEVEIKRVVDINVSGMIMGTSVALSQMKKQEFGTVYNMEGLGSNNMKIPRTLVYGGSKRFLTYFSQGCNKELKDYPKIRVGTLQPGMVFTDLLIHNMTEEGMKIARILGSKVEVVTPFLVQQMIKGKQTIKYLTFGKTLWRFLTAPFVKRNHDITL